MGHFQFFKRSYIDRRYFRTPQMEAILEMFYERKTFFRENAFYLYFYAKKIFSQIRQSSTFKRRFFTCFLKIEICRSFFHTSSIERSHKKSLYKDMFTPLMKEDFFQREYLLVISLNCIHFIHRRALTGLTFSGKSSIIRLL